MTFRQVEAFLAVARERSFSRGARRIHLSQPTLSEHIRELEHELGKQLFLRRGRSVSLTEAGRVFEQHAARLAGAAADARQAMADPDGLGGGSLLVGASMLATLASFALTTRLARAMTATRASNAPRCVASRR